MNDKIPFEDLSESLKQDIAGNLVKNHIYCNQSNLVYELMQKEVIYVDDYENYYMSDEVLKDVYDVETEEEIEELRDNGEDHKEIYEHWVCSDWLIHQLREIEEPILETDLETWWGRTCTGQAIKLDYNIQKLAYKYSYDERLFKQLKTA
tara:strand:- start:44 stop:493 length:450 start_codon:yes stop_codon:yes gene_type:complete